MKSLSAKLLLLLLLLQAVSHAQPQFDAFDGFLCVRGEFARTVAGAASAPTCAFWCSSEPRCQAFTMQDGPCQLFVFDKCSKSVRDCGCSRRGQLFLKRATALCPAGYGDDLCGVKYKLYQGVGNWTMGRRKCESETAGLVIMADVTDASEMKQVDGIYNNRSLGKSFWLGGLQLPGSPEPAGGWYWVACNSSVDASLWSSGEPDNRGSGENVIGRWYNSSSGLSDFSELSSPTDVLCECASPFN